MKRLWSTAAVVACLAVAFAPAASLAANAACDHDPACAVALTGHVASGAESGIPVSQATVSLYRAGTLGAELLATSVSDAAGRFRVLLPPDDGTSVRYVVARKGKALELVAVIGDATPAAVEIDEQTTVAAAYAFAQFTDRRGISGDAQRLRTAAAMAAALVSVQTGMPSDRIRTSPNADETNSWRALGTLANILAGCVRGVTCDEVFAASAATGTPRPATTWQAALAIARHPAANVRALFVLGERVRVYSHVLEPEHGPDSPFAELRLDAFTLAVKVNATGRRDDAGSELCPFGGPGNLIFDARGYAWITNNVIQGDTVSAHCFVVLKPDGTPADGTNGTPVSPIVGGGVYGQGFGIGLDPTTGNVWSGNFGWGGDLPIGSVSAFAPDGSALSPAQGFTADLDRVQGTTADAHGNIWMASFANDRVVIYPHGDPTAALAWHDGINRHPFHIVIDQAGAGWVSFTESASAIKFALTAAGLAPLFSVPIGSGRSEPKGMALDSRSNVWVTAGGESRLYAFGADGRALGAYAGGGIDGPWGTTVAGDDTVWIANFGPLDRNREKYGVSQLCGARRDACAAGARFGDALSPPTGYTLPSGGDEVRLADGDPLYGAGAAPSYQPLMRATAVHVDGAGNLWVTNNWKPDVVNDLLRNPGGDGLVIFVGIAAPAR